MDSASLTTGIFGTGFPAYRQAGLAVLKVQNSVPPEADRLEFSSHFLPNFSG